MNAFLGRIHHQSFRLKMRDMNQGDDDARHEPQEIPCPLLTLNQVLSINQETKIISWSYLAPSRYTSGSTRQQLVGKRLASQPGFFHNRNQTTIEFPFTPDDILIAWDVGPNDDIGCIPYIQNEDAVVMIEAMHRARSTDAASL